MEQQTVIQLNTTYNWSDSAIFQLTGSEFGLIFNTLQQLGQVNSILMRKLEAGIISGIVTGTPNTPDTLNTPLPVEEQVVEEPVIDAPEAESLN